IVAPSAPITRGASDRVDDPAPTDQPKVQEQSNTKKAPKASADAGEKPTDARSGFEFSYSPVGKRDPFRSYLAELGDVRQQTVKRPVQATERFELDQYRLTGLITGTSQPKALVEDPDKVGHTVRIGSYIGKNGGVITRITSDGFVVTEEFRAPTGELVKVPITVKLPKPEIEIVGN
ncbi:MAG: pilus assembly protein PilP, partial [Myxococcota bacterium]